MRNKEDNPVPEHTFVYNPVPEHEFCSGAMGGQLTELQHKADASNAETCLINTWIYRISVFLAPNNATIVESEKFGRIQEFP